MASARVRPLTRRELDELNGVRLDRRLSYRSLALLVDLPASTVIAVLKRINKKPNETTVYRLRRWLADHHAEVAELAREAAEAEAVTS